MEQISKEMHELRSDFNEFKKNTQGSLNDAQVTLKEIKDAFLGEGFMQGRGLIHEHVEMKGEIAFLKQQFQNVKSGLAGAKISMGIAASIGAGIMAMLQLIWNLIFKH